MWGSAETQHSKVLLPPSPRGLKNSCHFFVRGIQPPTHPSLIDVLLGMLLSFCPPCSVIRPPSPSRADSRQAGKRGGGPFLIRTRVEKEKGPRGLLAPLAPSEGNVFLQFSVRLHVAPGRRGDFKKTWLRGGGRRALNNAIFGLFPVSVLCTVACVHNIACKQRAASLWRMIGPSLFSFFSARCDLPKRDRVID